MREVRVWWSEDKGNWVKYWEASCIEKKTGNVAIPHSGGELKEKKEKKEENNHHISSDIQHLLFNIYVLSW